MICTCSVHEECQLADKLTDRKPMQRTKSRCDMVSVRESKTQSCSLMQYSGYRKQCAFRETIAAIKSRQNMHTYGLCNKIDDQGK